MISNCLAESVLAGQAKRDGDEASEEALAAAVGDGGQEAEESSKENSEEKEAQPEE